MKASPRSIVPLAVLAIGVAGAVVLIATRPEVEAKVPDVVAPLVRVVDVELVDLTLSVSTHGTVAPRTESTLVPEVSGRVLEISPALVSGGFFADGDLLVRIDPRDYEVALERARASVARASSEEVRAASELTRRRALAERDFASAAQLDEAIRNQAVAAATLREARAMLVQAERDLARTSLRAVFTGRVRDENVDVGQFVTRGAPIATLYAVDWAEVRLPVPDEELAFLDLPLVWRDGSANPPGPDVRLFARFGGAEREWRGRVVRTEGEIDARSRMVHVVARVEDPYGRVSDGNSSPLAVGLFVRGEIQGRVAPGVVVLPRAALRGDGQVLVLDAEGRLRFRDVVVLRSLRDEIVVSAGLSAGERVCVSALETVVDGMQVRVAPAVDVAAEGKKS
ncbi:MAG: efflux RND transporter periplasmic adaptor subunit [Myxococcota bacterium]